MTLKPSNQRLLIVAATVVVVTAFLQLGSFLIQYGVGSGVLTFGWSFVAGLPLVVTACAMGVILVVSICALRGLTIAPRTRALIAVGFLALSFAASPTWRNGNAYICRGLSHRITDGGSDNRLVMQLQGLLAENPQQTVNTTLDVTAKAPPWLKQLFPEKHVTVDLYNAEIRYLRVEAGGPLLRYGCCVGMTAQDLPPLREKTTLTVATNIIVFAE